MISILADAGTAIAADVGHQEAAQGIQGSSGLPYLALILWAGLVIFARHRVNS